MKQNNVDIDKINRILLFQMTMWIWMVMCVYVENPNFHWNCLGTSWFPPWMHTQCKWWNSKRELLQYKNAHYSRLTWHERVIAISWICWRFVCKQNMNDRKSKQTEHLKLLGASSMCIVPICKFNNLIFFPNMHTQSTQNQIRLLLSMLKSNSKNSVELFFWNSNNNLVGRV